MSLSRIRLADIPDYGVPIRFEEGDFQGAFAIRIYTPVPHAIKLNQGYVVGFSATCTHMGASLPPPVHKAPQGREPESLACGPCPWHGTSFDLMKAGLVILGPATQNLPQVRLEIEGENLVARGWIENDRQTRDPREEQWPLLQWRPTNAPLASSRTDDIWFLDEMTGWAVNSNGNIIKTEDGGERWTEQAQVRAYLRCISFATPLKGWAGTLTPGQRLFATQNGGATWTLMESHLPDHPSAVCGLSVVDEFTVYASGTNYPDRPAALMRTLDGGETWTAIDMSAHASLLVDCYFTSAQQGWVVGGLADVPNPPRRDVVKAIVLYTEDGGATWQNRTADIMDALPLGEWGWKIQFLNDMVGFVALENFHDGAILKTTDGGRTWTRLPVTDPQGNANLEGIGFVNERHGWVGGWGDIDFEGGYSSETHDGGRTWRDANHVGRFINRFRFFGHPVTVGYASGKTVYKYSREPVPTPNDRQATRLLDTNEPAAFSGPVAINYQVPEGAQHVTLDIWDRFRTLVCTLIDRTLPQPGPQQVIWDCTDDQGLRVEPGGFTYRLTIDNDAESRDIWLTS